MAGFGFDDVIKLFLSIAVPVMMISIGIHLGRGEVIALWRRPGLLGRSILASLVLCPLVAYLLTAWLKAPLPVAIGLLLTAASPSAPLGFVQTLKARGDTSYAAGMVATLAVLTIVSMPLTVWAAIGTPRLPLESVFVAVGTKILLPLGVGKALRALFPQISASIGRWAPAVIPPLLALAILAILFRHPEQLAIGWPTALTMLFVALANIAIGYALGGPPPHLRLSLSLLCGFRNAAVPMMLVVPYVPQALLPIAIFGVLSAFLSFGFATIWRKRHPQALGITLLPEKTRKKTRPHR
ncbi:bile acid:sodium symporter [bacterium]|nr:bile acid:sodium symporter [bacterium]